MPINRLVSKNLPDKYKTKIFKGPKGLTAFTQDLTASRQRTGPLQTKLKCTGEVVTKMAHIITSLLTLLTCPILHSYKPVMWHFYWNTEVIPARE